MAVRLLETIEVHSGYDFPYINPLHLIPGYAGEWKQGLSIVIMFEDKYKFHTKKSVVNEMSYIVYNCLHPQVLVSMTSIITTSTVTMPVRSCGGIGCLGQTSNGESLTLPRTRFKRSKESSNNITTAD